MSEQRCRTALAGRLAVALVSALVAILTTADLRVDAQASSSAGQVAETRVRAIGHLDRTIIGVDRHVFPGDGRGGPIVAAESVVGSRVAPQTAVRINKHHTVPSEILKTLPNEVASNPLVRGRAGAPNRWAMPEDVHKAIHQGPGGGLYNEAWKAELRALDGPATVDDVLRIRESLTKQFGIDIYRPS